MKHALVVGGTGMLSDVSLWLSNHDVHVSVIGRDPIKMRTLLSKSNHPSHITPLYVDYRDTQALIHNVQNQIKIHGPVDLLVTWIHKDGAHTLTLLIQEINSKAREWDFFHVLGSQTNLSQTKTALNLGERSHYHQIKLGFVLIDNQQSRWLTHEEISNGVIHAIKNKVKRFTVGVLEPWELRP